MITKMLVNLYVHWVTRVVDGERGHGCYYSVLLCGRGMSRQNIGDA